MDKSTNPQQSFEIKLEQQSPKNQQQQLPTLFTQEDASQQLASPVRRIQLGSSIGVKSPITSGMSGCGPLSDTDSPLITSQRLHGLSPNDTVPVLNLATKSLQHDQLATTEKNLQASSCDNQDLAQHFDITTNLIAGGAEVATDKTQSMLTSKVVAKNTGYRHHLPRDRGLRVFTQGILTSSVRSQNGVRMPAKSVVGPPEVEFLSVVESHGQADHAEALSWQNNKVMTIHVKKSVNSSQESQRNRQKSFQGTTRSVGQQSFIRGQQPVIKNVDQQPHDYTELMIHAQSTPQSRGSPTHQTTDSKVRVRQNNIIASLVSSSIDNKRPPAVGINLNYNNVTAAQFGTQQRSSEEMVLIGYIPGMTSQSNSPATALQADEYPQGAMLRKRLFSGEATVEDIEQQQNQRQSEINKSLSPTRVIADISSLSNRYDTTRILGLPKTTNQRGNNLTHDYGYTPQTQIAGVTTNPRLSTQVDHTLNDSEQTFTSEAFQIDHFFHKNKQRNTYADGSLTVKVSGDFQPQNQPQITTTIVSKTRSPSKIQSTRNAGQGYATMHSPSPGKKNHDPQSPVIRAPSVEECELGDVSYKYKQFDNPFNVLSFKSSNQGSPSRRFDIESRMKARQLGVQSPDNADLDLLQRDDDKEQLKLNVVVSHQQPAQPKQPELQRKEPEQQTPCAPQAIMPAIAQAKGSLRMFDHLMKARPRITTFEQLKRPKTNKHSLNEAEMKVVRNGAESFAIEVKVDCDEQMHASRLVMSQAASPLSGIQTGQMDYHQEPVRQSYVTKGSLNGINSTKNSEKLKEGRYKTNSNQATTKTTVPGFRQFPGKKKKSQRRKKRTRSDSLNDQDETRVTEPQVDMLLAQNHSRVGKEYQSNSVNTSIAFPATTQQSLVSPLQQYPPANVLNYSILTEGQIVDAPPFAQTHNTFKNNNEDTQHWPQRPSLQAHLSSALRHKLLQQNSSHSPKRAGGPKSREKGKTGDPSKPHAELIINSIRSVNKRNESRRLKPLIHATQQQDNGDYQKGVMAGKVPTLPVSKAVRNNQSVYHGIECFQHQQYLYPTTSPDKALLQRFPLSNDTSRSPIQIDPEIWKTMHQCLPPDLENSSLGSDTAIGLLSAAKIATAAKPHSSRDQSPPKHKTIKNQQKSPNHKAQSPGRTPVTGLGVKNEPHSSPKKRDSVGSSDTQPLQINADIKHFTQVKQFVVSPQAVQQTTLMQSQDNSSVLHIQHQGVLSGEGQPSTRRGLPDTNHHPATSPLSRGQFLFGSQSTGNGVAEDFAACQDDAGTQTGRAMMMASHHVVSSMGEKKTSRLSQTHINNSMRRNSQKSQNRDGGASSSMTQEKNLPPVQGKQMLRGSEQRSNLVQTLLMPQAEESATSRPIRGQTVAQQNTQFTQAQGLVKPSTATAQSKQDLGISSSKINVNVNKDANQNSPVRGEKEGVTSTLTTYCPMKTASGMIETTDNNQKSSSKVFEPVLKSKSYRTKKLTAPNFDQQSQLQSPTIKVVEKEVSSPVSLIAKEQLHQESNAIEDLKEIGNSSTAQLYTATQRSQPKEFVILQSVQSLPGKGQRDDGLKIQGGSLIYSLESQQCFLPTKTNITQWQQQAKIPQGLIVGKVDSVTTTSYDQGSRENILEPTYQARCDLPQQILQNGEAQKKRNCDSQSSSEETVTTEMANKLLRLDMRGLAFVKPKEHGILDFVAQKAHDFMAIQAALPKLDYNTQKSEAQGSLDNRADQVFKSLALETTGRHSPYQGDHGPTTPKDSIPSCTFNLNEKRNMLIKSEIPTSMLRFKNKSEQMRYLRVAKCILGLPSQHASLKKNPVDVEFTYMKVFRFLADVLSQAEFESLSYYHVNRFIQTIIDLSSSDDSSTAPQLGQQQSMRQFVHSALDLEYSQSKMSQSLLLVQNTNLIGLGDKTAALVKQPLWHVSHQSAKLDPNNTQHAHKFMKQSEKLVTGITAEARHRQIFDKIESEVRTRALEPGLPAVVRSSFFKDKETIRRGQLARLLQSQKVQNDVDFASLEKQSMIARNHVMLEHVLAKRNMQNWRDQVLSELHEENRKAKSVNAATRRNKGQHSSQKQ